MIPDVLPPISYGVGEADGHAHKSLIGVYSQFEVSSHSHQTPLSSEL